jgi:ketosteroid isomerase-like protein
MSTDELRDVIRRGDRAAFRELLDPDVVWVGVYPGQLCRSRAEVLDILDSSDNAAREFAPEILEEREGVVVLDPHADPPPVLVPNLCQVLIVGEGKIVEIRDYPSREAALEAVTSGPA